MLISRPILADLAVRLHALPSGLRAATVDVGDLDPLDVVRAGAAAFGFAAFFSSVDGRAFGALGVWGRVAASGPDRFARLDDGLRRMSPPDAIAPIGFSFADDGPSSAEWGGFPAAVAVVPQITVTRSAGRSQLSVSLPSGSDGQMLLALVSTLRPPAAPGTGREVDHAVESRPSPHDWLGLVAEAV